MEAKDINDDEGVIEDVNEDVFEDVTEDVDEDVNEYVDEDFNEVVAEDVNEDVNEVFDGDGTEDVKKASKELVSSESQEVHEWNHQLPALVSLVKLLSCCVIWIKLVRSSLNILGILSFHRMECCNECVQCVAAVSSQDRAAQTHAEGGDTGPGLVVTNVCSDDEKGTTYPRNH